MAFSRLIVHRTGNRTIKSKRRPFDSLRCASVVQDDDSSLFIEEKSGPVRLICAH
jgi:hypothetical protein